MSSSPANKRLLTLTVQLSPPEVPPPPPKKKKRRKENGFIKFSTCQDQALGEAQSNSDVYI